MYIVTKETSNIQTMRCLLKMFVTAVVFFSSEIEVGKEQEYLGPLIFGSHGTLAYFLKRP